METLENRPGILVLRATGKTAMRDFAHEAGGHRWQRVPKNEKRGRTHTSTVTVAILREATEAEVRLNPRDLDIKTTRGSGAGGQHRNTTDSAVQVTHKPSGITVRAESERSQHQNKAAALGLLRARLLARKQGQKAGRRNSQRKSQLGSGMRGDKVVTIALQRDKVTHHQTGKRMSAKKYLRGQIDLLWPSGGGR